MKNKLLLLVVLNIVLSLAAIGFSLYVYLTPPDNYAYQLKLQDWFREQNKEYEKSLYRANDESFDNVVKYMEAEMEKMYDYVDNATQGN